MSEMVERVMTAIREAIVFAESSGGISIANSEEVARAAIGAMREPTDAMAEAIHAGDFDVYWGYQADGRPGGPGDVYRAMIDAALK